MDNLLTDISLCPIAGGGCSGISPLKLQDQDVATKVVRMWCASGTPLDEKRLKVILQNRIPLCDADEVQRLRRECTIWTWASHPSLPCLRDCFPLYRISYIPSLVSAWMVNYTLNVYMKSQATH